MNNPYEIEGPAVISFSGGRTSGYMLRKILDVGLQPDVHILFANTGKERLETLDFIHECETRWKAKVHWLEYWHEPEDGSPDYREMSYETASREGQPFAEIIRRRGYLPTPVTRYCTSMLKTRPMRNYMRSLGYDDGDWTGVVGIRADEPRRVARMTNKNSEGRWDIVMPLHQAGATEDDVMAFWASQPFDLQIPQQAGNCDLCFLKSLPKKRNILRERPDLAAWWVDQERQMKALGQGPFRIDQPTFLQMLAQPDLFSHVQDDNDLIECACTD
jgi:3'-phosphoadenosine 5'-phosphosulfate sulfotransferase (PAPS reductase)/FAD synthetase